MRAIIDTNVLVSAALKDRDPEAIILWIAAQADWEWVVSLVSTTILSVSLFKKLLLST